MNLLLRTSESKSIDAYMPQLDGLRTVAVFAVIVHHFLPVARFIPSDFVSLGSLGVRLFFVLSGFLITGILLKCREENSPDDEPSSFKLRQFYIRRLLRIFPIFYLTLALIAIFNLPTVRGALPWHLSYMSNVYFALRGSFDGPLSHFWSLAVEEQFYLVWPWIIIFVPTKYLHSAVIVTVFVAPFFRLLIYLLGGNELASFILLFGCMDSLALGALLAYYHSKKSLASKVSSLLRFSLGTGVLLVTLLAVLQSQHRGGWLYVTAIHLGTSLILLWLVGHAATGFTGLTGKLLALGPVLYIGRISYGIYIFHNLMPVIVPKLFSILGLPYPQGRGATIKQFLILSVATLVLAGLSWRFFEGPINSLKRHFQYGRPRGKGEPLTRSVDTVMDFS
ncbi:MAG: acyltransferase [Pyrinomonadaceae bacterium]|nr:acyltransferase [Pyrinomonadaceae bacterium]